jgi:hypothetical protein
VQPFILEVNWGALRLHYERLHVLTSWGGEMGGCSKLLKLFEKFETVRKVVMTSFSYFEKDTG